MTRQAILKSTALLVSYYVYQQCLSSKELQSDIEVVSASWFYNMSIRFKFCFG